MSREPGIKEVEALRSIVEMLEAFDWQTQCRMLTWLRAFCAAREQQRKATESDQTQDAG